MPKILIVSYTTGDATRPTGDGRKVIAHVCNDIGAWGKGFVLAISARWKEPEKCYRKWAKFKTNSMTGCPFELGQVQFVEVEDDIVVANMIGQRGISRHSTGPRRHVQKDPPIRYTAIEQAFRKVCAYAKVIKASVHIPRIGCGLAGGTWEDIGPIVETAAKEFGVSVTVYDYR